MRGWEGPRSSLGADRPASPTAKVAVAVACTLVVLLLPAAVVPAEYPRLTFDPAAVEEVFAHDAALARSAPSSEAVDRLRSLEYDRAELETTPHRADGSMERMMASVRYAVRQVTLQDGPGAIAALRAQAVEQVIPALRGDLTPEVEHHVLGSFPTIVDRYDLAEGGKLVAPPIVIRSLYKAVWNFAHNQPPTEGFAAIEREAYWGWLLTHGGEDIPAGLEQHAVTELMKATPSPVAREIVGVHALRRGSTTVAAQLFDRLWDETHQLRFRNYAAAARADATGTAEP